MLLSVEVLLFLFVFFRNVHVWWRVFQKEIWFNVSNVFLQHISHEEIYMIRLFFECFLFVSVRILNSKCDLTVCKMGDSEYMFILTTKYILFSKQLSIRSLLIYFFFNFVGFIDFNIRIYVYLFKKEFFDSNRTRYTYYTVHTENPASV